MTEPGRRARGAAPLVLYFDGASRGNPGPSAYGVWSPSGLEASAALGTTTNNVAEWRGFLAALDLAVASGAEDVEIRADSQLVLRQFSGEYRMKAPHLAEYLAAVRHVGQVVPLFTGPAHRIRPARAKVRVGHPAQIYLGKLSRWRHRLLASQNCGNKSMMTGGDASIAP